MRLIITVFFICALFGASGQDSISVQKTVNEDFHLRSKYLYFGFINSKSTVTKTYIITNNSNGLMEIDSTSIQSHEFISVKFEPTIIESGTNARMIVALNTSNANSLGYNEFEFEFNAKENDQIVRKEFFIVVNIHEYFDEINNEDEIPKLLFDRSKHDFKAAYSGDTLFTTFDLTNVGSKMLNIRSLKTNCSCISWELDKMEIDPGSTVQLKVFFYTNNRNGYQYKNITVFSNDPSAPTQMLKLKAKVESI